MTNDLVAILCADLHLSHRAPTARSEEKDWLTVQAGYLHQLADLAYGPFPVPIIIAGDLFDRPNPPAELVNMVLAELPPNVYAIPGNHDLAYHSYADLKKTAYWTLAEAGRIVDVRPGRPVEVPGKRPLRLHGFPWGSSLKPLEDPHDLIIEIAIVHRYLWISGKGHPKARPEHEAKAVKKLLRGYDVAVFGDNHQSFDVSGKDPLWICNCGGLIRRTADEEKNKPSVILLSLSEHNKIEARRHYLDVSKDVFLDIPERLERKVDAAGFLEGLKDLGDSILDFPGTVRRALESRGLPEQVRRIILKAMVVGFTPRAEH